MSQQEDLHQLEQLKTSSSAAFWAVLFVIIVLVTALNFVKANSGHHEEPAKVEASH